MTTKEFIETLVTIELIDDTTNYGHYPFQLVSEDPNRSLTVAALCLGGDVHAVYRTAGAILDKGAVKLFLSIDFPAGRDISHDFVSVYTLVGDKLDCIAIPYDPLTGEQFLHVASGEMIDLLKLQFIHIVLN